MDRSVLRYLVPIYIILFVLLFVGMFASAILLAIFESEFVFIPLMILYVLMFPLMFIGYAFWVFMMVDCSLRKFKNRNHKIVWIVMMCIFSYLASFVYYYVEGKKKLK